jgi:hypothetical protein
MGVVVWCAAHLRVRGVAGVGYVLPLHVCTCKLVRVTAMNRSVWKLVFSSTSTPHDQLTSIPYSPSPITIHYQSLSSNMKVCDDLLLVLFVEVGFVLAVTPANTFS